MKNPKYLYWVLPLFIFPLAIVFIYFLLSPKVMPPIKKIEAFSLVDENNQKFYSDSFVNKMTVVSFIFTSCKGQCPILIHQAKKLLTQFRDPKFQIVSITIDPVIDTPGVLKEYKNRNHIENRHIFLTGNKEVVKRIIEKNFLVAGEKNDDEIAHSTQFILVDENENILGYYDAFNKEDFVKLSENISRRLKDSKNKT